jgi:hypothetical protein
MVLARTCVRGLRSFRGWNWSSPVDAGEDSARAAVPSCAARVSSNGGREGNYQKKKVGGKADKPTVWRNKAEPNGRTEQIFLAGFCQFWDSATSHIVIYYSYNHHTTYCFLTEQIAAGGGNWATVTAAAAGQHFRWKLHVQNPRPQINVGDEKPNEQPEQVDITNEESKLCDN